MITKKTNENTDPLADHTDMNRRDFLSSTAAVGGAMVVGFWLPPSRAHAQAPPAVQGQAVAAQPWYRDSLVPEVNAWITIAPDDTVTIRVNQTELGTGVFTANSMMVAEELQCDWSKVRVEYASANRDVKEKAPAWTLKTPPNDITNPSGNTMTENSQDGVYREMITHSSGNVRQNRYYLQLAGAEARERLLLAAATAWGVPVSALVAKDSVITHAASKRRITYGAIAAKAATIQLPDPSTIKIKTPDKWTLMGTEQKNRDVPLKVTGQAIYAEGWARSIAIEDRRRPSRPHGTICAEVHTVEVTRRGQVRLHRVDVAFEAGFGVVHPLAVRKQIEGQIHWAYDEAMYQENTVRDGRCVERNLDTFPISRINEYPKELNIAFFKTNMWIYGAGEEAIPQGPPALCNAVFKVTGKRIRSIPLKNHDLSWG